VLHNTGHFDPVQFEIVDEQTDTVVLTAQFQPDEFVVFEGTRQVLSICLGGLFWYAIFEYALQKPIRIVTSLVLLKSGIRCLESKYTKWCLHLTHVPAMLRTVWMTLRNVNSNLILIVGVKCYQCADLCLPPLFGQLIRMELILEE
jgi:hypothetical protein